MKGVQQWFDQVLGVVAEEARIRKVAEELFRPGPEHFAGLEAPACWRRRSKVVLRAPLARKAAR